MWMFEAVRPFMTESATAMLSQDDRLLTFVSCDEPSGGWHNLKTLFGRFVVETALTERLVKRFPRWSAADVRPRLREIPPLSVLNPEIGPAPEAAIRELSVAFILDFMSASYCLHLGYDPLRRDQDGDAKTDEDLGIRIHKLLKAHSPRYVEGSYASHFSAITRRDPFAGSFEIATRALRELGWDTTLIDETLRAIAFPYSLVHARDVMTAPDLVEVFGDGATTAYHASFLTAHYGLQLKGFRDGEARGDMALTYIAFQIPTLTELWGLGSKGRPVPSPITTDHGVSRIKPTGSATGKSRRTS
jgi:hypothetical protein